MMINGNRIRILLAKPTPHTSLWHSLRRADKLRHAKNISTKLKWTGRFIGAYNARSIQIAYTEGKMQTSQMIIEQSVNTFSTFGGLRCTSFGIGWELGRTISMTNSYQNFKQSTILPWRLNNFGY